jgi:hypothetical protein
LHAFCLFLQKNKSIKKGWKILIITSAVVILILGAFYFSMQNKTVQTYITQKLADKFSEQLNIKIHIGEINIAFFNKVILENFWAEDNNHDTLAFINRMVASIDSFSVTRKMIAFKNISFNNSGLKITVDSAGNPNYRFPEISSGAIEDSSGRWKIFCDDFTFRNADLYYEWGKQGKKNNLLLENINFSVSGFRSTDDSLGFKLKDFSLKGSDNFSIKKISASISSSDKKTILSNLDLETTRSTISDANLELNFQDTLKTSALPEINLFIKNSHISLEDLAIFLPSLQGMNQVFEFSGDIYGSLADLKGKNISIQTGKNTAINCNFYVNGLPDINNIYLFFDLTHLQTDFTDLSNIKLPVASRIRNLSFPDPFYQAGLITYQGNFTGFLSDFVAYGNLESQMGKVSTDLMFKPVAKKRLSLNGRVKTVDFNIGELFKNPDFDKISFDGEMDGEFDKLGNDINGTFRGTISDFGAYGYIYKNVSIDGKFNNKNFDGILKINDPNLDLDFIGKFNLNPKIPEFNFDMILRKANLTALKIDKSDKISDLALGINANFTGNNIDNLNGFINLENGTYRNSNGVLTFKSINIKSESTDNSKILTINSDFFDSKIVGVYNLHTLPGSFAYILSKYIPALNSDTKTDSFHNSFKYKIDVRDVNNLFAVFNPGLTIDKPFSAEGQIDTDKNLLSLDGTIPGISIKNAIFKDISVRAAANDSYSLKIKVGQMKYGSGLNIYNLSLNSDAINNRIETRITWNNFHALSYSGEINASTLFSGTGQNLNTGIEIKPSKIYIADSLWNLNQASISIDSSQVFVQNLTLKDQNQSVTLNGSLSKNKKDRLSLVLKNISIEGIESYLQTGKDIKGIINGSVDLEDFYGDKILYSDLNISGFNFRGQDLGYVTLSNKWDNVNAVIKSNLKVEKNDVNQLLSSGFYDPVTDKFEFNATLDSLPVVLLEQVIGDVLTNYKGTTSGHLKIYGDTVNTLVEGALMGKNVGITVPYTNVSYRFNDSVYFKKNAIVFDHIRVLDELNNPGVFDGTITHQNFGNMVFDLHVSSPKILAMNTTVKNDDQFYGKIIADGNFSITGTDMNTKLSGNGKTLLGTEVNISLDYEQEAEQYDFIRFINKGSVKEKEKTAYADTSNSSTTLNLRIEVTPEAKAQLIYNSQIGDIIKGQGDGILQFGMDKNGDITIYGTYNIVQGDYLFTLKNIINKRFTIEPGGKINWSGNPYNAKIDIQAVYRLKASIYELFYDYQYVDKSQRIPVECKILLTDNLLNPNIKFDVAFPMVETKIVDELQQYFNTEEELNRQIFWLVVLGQFYVPDYRRGSYEAATNSSYLIGSTMSELFSNQFSNWISHLGSKVDIGLNYLPATQMTKNEIELSLSKQMFNNRVTINGNIGNNVHPGGINTNSGNNNDVQIVGDFDLKVKLTDNGKVQFKAFNRSNNNIIYETSPYTQGIGMTFKEDYNTFDELINKLFTIFRAKKGRKK